MTVASVGGDVGDVSTGIAAGKNAVENNELVQYILEAIFERSKKIKKARRRDKSKTM